MSDLVVAHNCCLARMLPGEAENGVGMSRSVREGKKCKALSGPTDWILRYIKTYLYLYMAVTDLCKGSVFGYLCLSVCLSAPVTQNLLL